MGRDRQRTKGGIKPSSSGRTAELLAKSNEFESSGGFSTSFSSFSGPTFDTTLESDLAAGLSSELKIIIGKLNKKDSTTKIKAIQELIDLCRNEEDGSGGEICSEILKFWPRIYSKIAKDDSRRVRELSHVLLEVIGLSVGRKLAPFLKLIAPTWFLSQSDIFPPASSSAQNAFKKVFATEKKQMEALVFCKDEIISLICDNLEKPLSETKKSAIGETTSKKNKNVTAGDGVGFTADLNFEAEVEPYSLRMLYASILSCKRASELDLGNEEFFNELLNNDNFWGLTKHENPLIRRVTFDLISTLANKIQVDGKKCTLMIDQALKSESQSDVLQSLWNCFLLLNLKGFYNFGVVENSTAHKQILLCVKKGFYGNSSTLGPFLLPLISKLPAITLESVSFRKELFDSFENGFMIEKSLMEKSSLLTTFAEVIAFLIKKAEENSNTVIEEEEESKPNDDNGNEPEKPKSSKTFNLNEHIFMFISKRLKDATSQRVLGEFACTIGKLVKNDKFYEEFLFYPGFYYDDKFGRFIVDLCRVNEKCNQVEQRRKSVKFREEESNTQQIDQSKSTSCHSKKSDYEILPDYKKRMIHTLTKLCLEKKALKTLAIIIKSFSSDPNFFNEIFTKDSNEEEVLLESLENCSTNLDLEESKSIQKFALSINLDFLKIYPDKPKVLGTFSHLYDQYFSQSVDSFNEFITQINQGVFYDIVSIRKWLKMPLFCDKMKGFIVNEEKYYMISPIIKFIIERGDKIFSSDVMTGFLNLFQDKFNQQGTDFAEGLAQTILQILYNNSNRIQTDISQLLLNLWKKYVAEILSKVMISGDQDHEEYQYQQEFNSFVIGENCEKLAIYIVKHKIISRQTILAQVILQFVNFKSCDTLQKLQNLIGITKTLLQIDFSTVELDKYDVELVDFLTLHCTTEESLSFQLFRQVKYFPEFLTFLGLSLASSSCHSQAIDEKLDENLLTILTTGELKSYLVKILYLAKIQYEFDHNLIETIPLLVYGQSIINILHEFERTRWTKQYDSDIFTEYNTILPLVLKKVVLPSSGSDARSRSSMKVEEDNLDKISTLILSVKNDQREDPIWASGLPLNCLTKFANDLDFELDIEEDSISDNQVSFKNMCRRLNDENMMETIQVLKAERKLSPEKFHFDMLWRNIQPKARPELFALIDCVIKIFKEFLNAQQDAADDKEESKESKDAAEFISIATCWISAWLNKTKTLYWTKSQFLWILKLSQAVELIAQLARCQKYSTFTTEYMEFHSSQIYLPLYYIFLKISGQPDVQIVESIIEESKAPTDLATTDDESKNKVVEVDAGYRLGGNSLEEPQVICPENLRNNFWRLSCAQKVSSALISIPSRTLAYIQPLPREISRYFTPIIDFNEIYFKVGACKILKKMKVKAQSGVDADDLPIIPVEINEYLNRSSKLILKSIQKFEDRARDYDEDNETIEEIYSKSKWPVSDELLTTYLLVWDALLSLQLNNIQDSNEFASFVKETHLLPRLLSIIFFTIIPPNYNPKNYFDVEPKLDANTIPNIHHLTCSVLQKTLRILSYTCRGWWSQLTRQKDKVHVEKFITKYLSMKLAKEELGKVKWNEDSDNVTVHSHPGCNELVARYKIEETTVSLTISLPLNHPLGPVTVKISDKKLHSRISQLLNSRSHNLAAGLKLWKENLDDLYKNVEECTICFFVVHSATKQLPKLTCKVCKKKFHAACLLKWFNTSNKSECPLCRNIF